MQQVRTLCGSEVVVLVNRYSTCIKGIQSFLAYITPAVDARVPVGVDVVLCALVALLLPSDYRETGLK